MPQQQLAGGGWLADACWTSKLQGHSLIHRASACRSPEEADSQSLRAAVLLDELDAPREGQADERRSHSIIVDLKVRGPATDISLGRLQQHQQQPDQTLDPCLSLHPGSVVPVVDKHACTAHAPLRPW